MRGTNALVCALCAVLGANIVNLTALVAGARADVSSQWIGGSGDFSSPANWQSGVPGPAGTAIFDTSTSAYTVQVAGDIVISKLRFDENTVTLRPSSNGGTLSVTDATTYPLIPGGVVIGEGFGNTATVNSYMPKFSAVSIVLAQGANAVGTLNVNSGSVNCVTAEIPSRSGLGTGLATVNGADASVNLSGDFYVGYVGQGTFNISKGGTANSANGYLGGGGLATVNIDGTGSTWNLSGRLEIDSPESGGSSRLSITNGGHVTSAGSSIGSANYGVGPSQVTVDGSGSTWNNTGSYAIGEAVHHGAGELEILNGGHVTSDNARIISASADTPSKVVVDGVSSIWNIGTNLKMGVSPGSVEFDVSNGGTVTIGTNTTVIAGEGNYDNSRAAASMLVDGASSTITIGGFLNIGGNAGGTLTVSNGAHVRSASSVIYPKNWNTPGKALITGSGSTWNTSGDIILDGLFTVSDGAQASVGDKILIQEEGELHGNGTITGNVQNGALVAPGPLPGRMTIAGNYSQIASGTLLIDLGGRTAVTEYDQLSVTGNSMLDGTLSVALIDGFAPKLGDSFDILDWGTLSGMFSTLQLPALNMGLAWDTSQLYTTGAISVATVPEPATAVLLAIATPALVAVALRRRSSMTSRPAR
jgi:subtilase-type serine protease